MACVSTRSPVDRIGAAVRTELRRRVDRAAARCTDSATHGSNDISTLYGAATGSPFSVAGLKRHDCMARISAAVLPPRSIRSTLMSFTRPSAPIDQREARRAAAARCAASAGTAARDACARLRARAALRRGVRGLAPADAAATRRCGARAPCAYAGPLSERGSTSTAMSSSSPPARASPSARTRRRRRRWRRCAGIRSAPVPARHGDGRAGDRLVLDAALSRGHERRVRALRLQVLGVVLLRPVLRAPRARASARRRG